ncbi:preprotein translocase subunit YajC [bacterium]
MVSLLYAAEETSGAVQAQAANPLSSFFPIILLFVLFYFFLIRPQQKKSKEHQSMIKELKKGDSVITSGGIIGTIIGTKDNLLELNISENVNIKITRDSISRYLKPEQQKEENK